MHVNAKRIAFLGLLLAVCVILVFFGGTMEMNTLFFLAAASFCVGIAVREYGIGMGSAFLGASIVLGFLFTPNKLYVGTYFMMGMYILLSEAVWFLLCRIHKKGNSSVQHVKRIFWIVRYLIFNVIYLPVIILFPNLIIAKDITWQYMLVAVVCGQIALFIFEKAYCYFQSSIWSKFKKNLNK